MSSQARGCSSVGFTRKLSWSAVLLGWLAAWSQGADLLDQIRILQAGNTHPDTNLTPTLCVLLATPQQS